MTAASTPDPTRAQVEATLQRVAGNLAMLPCAAVRALSGRLAQPLGVVRSLATLAWEQARPPVAPEPSPAPPPPRGNRAPGSNAAAADADARDVTAASVRRDPVVLPIEDYESLPASQVVARLARLSRRELAEIAEFESAGRGRRTILGKIDQLLTDG